MPWRWRPAARRKKPSSSCWRASAATANGTRRRPASSWCSCSTPGGRKIQPRSTAVAGCRRSSSPERLDTALPSLVERYRGPADLPQRIAFFPLRGAILLPRSGLPLNVFEPRYLAMIEDVMSGLRVLGIVQPASGDSDESPVGKSAPLRRVGCVGRITAYQELDDGRLGIGLTGVARCMLESEVPSAKPYRTFTVDFE